MSYIRVSVAKDCIFFRKKFTDIAAPPFSPRPDVKPRKDKDFTDEFVVLDFLGRFVSFYNHVA